MSKADNKELEEAINYLKLIRKNHDLEKKGYVYTEEAIETVLQALENSISKEVIEKKIEELKEQRDEYIKMKEYNQVDIKMFKINILEELLEKE